MGTAYEAQLSTAPLFVTTTVLISTVPADIWGNALFGDVRLFIPRNHLLRSCSGHQP
jgi:hypothetical protein